MDSLYMTYI